MALNEEEEIVTQQQQVDTDEATDNPPENQGATLTTVTTRSPSYATIGTGGRGGRHGGRGAGRGCGQRRKAITCFRCGKRGQYASECDATTEEVQQYRATQAAKHESGEQLLHSGVLQDDPNNDITTSWIFSQLHVVHDQTHLETRHGGRLLLEWVLLDNQSTIDVFVSRWLLKNQAD